MITLSDMEKICEFDVHNFLQNSTIVEVENSFQGFISSLCVIIGIIQ